MKQESEQVRRFLGTWGCKVSLLDDEELLVIAKMSFDVPGKTLLDVNLALKRLPRTERSARVREAILRYWPKPTILWPPQSNARKLLAKTLEI